MDLTTWDLDDDADKELLPLELLWFNLDCDDAGTTFEGDELDTEAIAMQFLLFGLINGHYGQCIATVMTLIDQIKSSNGDGWQCPAMIGEPASDKRERWKRGKRESEERTCCASHLVKSFNGE